MRTRHLPLAGLVTLAAACGQDSEGLPTTPPTQVTRLALTTTLDTRFTEATDAVASPDGSRFYFIARTVERIARPAIFSVPSQGGAVTRLAVGAPLGEPTGLLMSCDGSTLYVADLSYQETEAPEEGGADSAGALFTLDPATGTLVRLTADGIDAPAGLAMSDDCSELYVTGYDEIGLPALFTLPAQGGTATIVTSGDPLVTPAGVFVDEDDIAWVMDHGTNLAEAPGLLYAIDPDGTVTTVLEGLRLGDPGGVSLAAGGRTAVIPDVDNAGQARLVSVDTMTGERQELLVPEGRRPGGIRTARNAGVFVVTDNEGGAIFRAE